MAMKVQGGQMVPMNPAVKQYAMKAMAQCNDAETSLAGARANAARLQDMVSDPEVKAKYRDFLASYQKAYAEIASMHRAISAMLPYVG